MGLKYLFQHCFHAALLAWKHVKYLFLIPIISLLQVSFTTWLISSVKKKPSDFYLSFRFSSSDQSHIYSAS